MQLLWIISCPIGVLFKKGPCQLWNLVFYESTVLNKGMMCYSFCFVFSFYSAIVEETQQCGHCRKSAHLKPILFWYYITFYKHAEYEIQDAVTFTQLQFLATCINDNIRERLVLSITKITCLDGLKEPQNTQRFWGTKFIGYALNKIFRDGYIFFLS